MGSNYEHGNEVKNRQNIQQTGEWTDAELSTANQHNLISSDINDAFIIAESNRKL